MGSRVWEVGLCGWDNSELFSTEICNLGGGREWSWRGSLETLSDDRFLDNAA